MVRFYMTEFFERPKKTLSFFLGSNRNKKLQSIRINSFGKESSSQKEKTGNNKERFIHPFAKYKKKLKREK